MPLFYDLYGMSWQYLHADRIFPVASDPVRDGILVVDVAGKIDALIDPAHSPEDHHAVLLREDIRKVKGALVPGFINSHCHLELSHLKEKIAQGTGLPGFLKSVTTQRQADRELIRQAMMDANKEMEKGGIIAVGDISNTSDSITIKQGSTIRYHTFIEAFDLHPDYAEERFKSALELEAEFISSGLTASIVPHATYTVSDSLFRLIKEHAGHAGMPICIHNQETEDEDDLFMTGEGELARFLFATGKYSHWNPTGQSALRSTLPMLPVSTKLLLVHNTFSQSSDIQFAMNAVPDLWWCLCPAANAYIESSFPPLEKLIQHRSNIVLGTDSLASNTALSVLHEMKIVHQYHPELTFNQILKWVTLSPAEFFGWNNQFGSFEKGKTPGVIQLIDEKSDHGEDYFNATEISRLF
jgi:cytosine/adenosine deaminase-related metal-dependent hydrolase